MDDEFYCLPSTVLVFSAVVYALPGDVPQDDRLLEDHFQLYHVVNGCTAFMYPIIPLLDFPSPYRCKSLASQGTLKVIHSPLCHAVEVAVSQRSKVGRVRVSDGVEAVDNCGDRVGILEEHTLNSRQNAGLCVPRTSMTPWHFFCSIRTGSNLSSRTQSSSFSRRNLSLRIKSPSGSAVSSWVALTSVIRVFRANMHAVGNLDATNVKWVIFFHSPRRKNCRGAVNLKLIFGVVKTLDPLVGRKPQWGRDLVIEVDKF